MQQNVITSKGVDRQRSSWTAEVILRWMQLLSFHHLVSWQKAYLSNQTVFNRPEFLFTVGNILLLLCIFFNAGNPPQCNAWIGQCGLYILVMIIEKLLMTLLVLFDFWRDVSNVCDVFVVAIEKKGIMNVFSSSSAVAYSFIFEHVAFLGWNKRTKKLCRWVRICWQETLGLIKVTEIRGKLVKGEFTSGVYSYKYSYFLCFSGETIHHVSDQRSASWTCYCDIHCTFYS